MLNRLNFLFLILYSYRKKHIAVFIISTVLVALLSSVLFISSSIQKDLQETLSEQADFTLQKYKAGKVLNTPEFWINQFLEIRGISSVQGRVYGKYFYEPLEKYFMIVGIDIYDTQIIKTLQNLLDNLDIDKFQSKNYMIIGSGIKALFDYYEYKDNYNFRPPDRSIKKVYIYDSFPLATDILSSDTIIMDINLAREILGVEDGYVTDIIAGVKNKNELQTIKEKLIISHFDMRIIQKNDIAKYYKNLFNYKTGVFLALFSTTLLTFLLILYQRYSTVSYEDSKEVATLRMVGWKIKDVIYFKLFENFIVAFNAYLLGVLLAFIYVFIFDAPVIKNIFLGYKNLQNQTTFSPAFDNEQLFIIFLGFVIPFILAIIIPVYKVAITEPTEIMK